MKTILLLLCLGLAVNAEYCFNNVQRTCGVAGDGSALQHCNAKYSGVMNVFPELTKYMQQHISHSFQHLLMATNFANYEKNREGFSKLYRKMSDESWEDALDLIKYVNKRGGTVNFAIQADKEPNPNFEGTFEMHELESLSRALDMHKVLAKSGHKIHSEVAKHHATYHDAETLSYLEEKFAEKHAERIRELSGYTNDLSNLIKAAGASKQDSSMSIYLFDEYLQSVI